MLIPQMTPHEMLEEMNKDNAQLYDLNMRFLTTGGIKHLRRQGAKFPAYVMKEQKTSRGNRYLCDFLFRKRGDVFTLNGLESRLALMQTKEGLSGVSIGYGVKYQKMIVYIYKPHVYKRYKERMGLDIEGVELIRYFDKRNCDTIINDGYVHKEGDAENDIMLTIHDGALFGTKQEFEDCVCYTIKTFIANDTMQEGYKSQFNNQYNQAIDDIMKTVEQYGLQDNFEFDYHKRR